MQAQGRLIWSRQAIGFAVTLGLILGLLLGLGGCPSESSGPKGEVELRGNIRVVWLRGTPYEMGLQHALLLHDELIDGKKFIEDDIMFSTMLEYSKTVGLDATALAYSYPDLVDECQGLADGMDGEWSLDECLILNYGDVIVDVLHLAGIGCSQFVATDAATGDGALIHGRNLDWWEVELIENYPVIFVREPTDAIPWVSVGFPGNLSPYTGMNLAGIAVGSNEETRPHDEELARQGRSHVQMVREILRSASTLEEAEAFLRAQEHASAEILVVSDGPQRKAAAFEMTAHHFGVRYLSQEGLLWATNHFVSPDMEATQDPEPVGSSSWNRFERLRQLLSPGEPDTLYGSLDVPGAISILRDTYNPTSGQWEDPLSLDGAALGSNGTMQSVVFLPAAGLMWVAVGQFPSAVREFVGFSLPALFGEPDPILPEPASYPAETLQ